MKETFEHIAQLMMDNTKLQEDMRATWSDFRRTSAQEANAVNAINYRNKIYEDVKTTNQQANDALASIPIVCNPEAEIRQEEEEKAEEERLREEERRKEIERK